MALVVPVFRARLGYITRLGWFIGSSGRIDLETGFAQPLVMAFARPQHQPVLAEVDGLLKTVGRDVMNG